MMHTDKFKTEVLEWASELGVEPKEIHIRPMRRKWGTCSSRGRLTFSLDLLNKPFEARAKAIVHELLHLRYPTHTKMFNSLLVSYLSRRGVNYSEIDL